MIDIVARLEIAFAQGERAARPRHFETMLARLIRFQPFARS
jgi:hypothetical protein